MSHVSEAYADLGGGLSAAQDASHQGSPNSAYPEAQPSSAPSGVCVSHLFNPVSGWCGCGLRDDGKVAEGSPAWRAKVDAKL
ncbi:hypothetical protein GCM10009860_11550 [Microbacterium mitrae]